MKVCKLTDGLWRWTTPHPGWQPDADWPREVGCVFYEASDAIVLVDPLIPAEPAEHSRFLSHLDADIERSQKPVAILLTVGRHARSSAELAERYGARISEPVVAVVKFPFPDVEESVYWLGEHDTLIVGESLFGDGAGRLSLCLNTLVKGERRLALRDSLRPLLDLPVERILTSHGEPVLEDARAALARLARALAG